MTAVDPWLGEDGRCRKTDFFPNQCGCKNHRGGEVLDVEEKKIGRPRAMAADASLSIRRIIRAEHQSYCTLDECERTIKLGDEIGYVVDENHQSCGWACPACTTWLLENGE